jgi:hypothetical protein
MSPASRTISRGHGDLGGRERARRARSAPFPLSPPIPGRPVYKSVYVQRARARFWRRHATSFEFVHLACLDSIVHLVSGQGHSGHIPDHGSFSRDRPQLAGDGPRPVRAGSAWPLVLTGVSAVVSRVKRDFACTWTGTFQPVLVTLRGQSRLGLEGRTRILSGPSPDLTSYESVLARVSHAAVVSRFLIVGAWQVGSLCEDVAVIASAVLPSGSPSLEVCVTAPRPPAAWLTGGPADPLTVRDRDGPQWLLRRDA